MPSILRAVVIIIIIIIIIINREWQGTTICQAYTKPKAPPQKKRKERIGVKNTDS
jgi:hypothetical protein